MNEIILLSAGILAIFGSIFYFIIRRIRKKLRRYVLRFEKIEDRFE